LSPDDVVRSSALYHTVATGACQIQQRGMEYMHCTQQRAH
jgi:hypothetical protein